MSTIIGQGITRVLKEMSNLRHSIFSKAPLDHIYVVLVFVDRLYFVSTKDNHLPAYEAITFGAISCSKCRQMILV